MGGGVRRTTILGRWQQALYPAYLLLPLYFCLPATAIISCLPATAIVSGLPAIVILIITLLHIYIIDVNLLVSDNPLMSFLLIFLLLCYITLLSLPYSCSKLQLCVQAEGTHTAVWPCYAVTCLTSSLPSPPPHTYLNVGPGADQ